MYKEHPKLEKPEDKNTKIWRYIDFTKFLSLLDKSSLYFTRVDSFADPFEGSFSKANVKLRPNYFKGKIPPRDIKTLSEFYRTFVKLTVVNCWHISDYRSATMWEAYLKSSNGVAIRSTFSMLKDSFRDTKWEIYIGKVKYISYQNDLMPEGTLFPYFHKRKQFEDERELRAVIQEFSYKGDEIDWSKSPFREGLHVPVNLDLLIDSIYLAPKCHQWQLELIKSVVKKYGLRKKVVLSSLYEKDRIVY